MVRIGYACEPDGKARMFTIRSGNFHATVLAKSRMRAVFAAFARRRIPSVISEVTEIRSDKVNGKRVPVGFIWTLHIIRHLGIPYVAGPKKHTLQLVDLQSLYG